MGARASIPKNILKLSQLSGAPFEMLTRFMRMIQVQRQDFNGRMLTIRRDDLRAIACILGTVAVSVFVDMPGDGAGIGDRHDFAIGHRVGLVTVGRTDVLDRGTHVAGLHRVGHHQHTGLTWQYRTHT